MSNSNEAQNASQPSSGKPEGNRKATLIRQGVLIGILVIVGGALAYDYLVARPKAQAAYDKADELSKSNVQREAVIQEMGKPSSTMKKKGDVTIDVYSTLSGVIFRTYKVYIVYNANGVIESITKDKEPEEMALADADSSEASDSEDSASESTNPAGNPVNPGSGGDPATFVAMIMQNDADGDGKLSGDEIPERMRAILDQVDTNADGAIDREELTAMAERRGNGNGDGGDRPQRPSRPETDE